MARKPRQGGFPGFVGAGEMALSNHGDHRSEWLALLALSRKLRGLRRADIEQFPILVRMTPSLLFRPAGFGLVS